MNKKLMAVLGAGVLTALTATSAMALENEFHGMYKFMGFYGNFFNGASGNLSKDASSGFMAEQRARLQYTAKASDDLKLVTHFEMDTRFGGKDVASTGYLGTVNGNDGGNLDADQLTFETKSLYLDFNCPITKSNVKVGLQPWADSYQSLFLLADMTGVYVTKKFDPMTLSGGWFRINDDTGSSNVNVADINADLFIADAKFAVNKDFTVGASYYLLNNDKNIGAGLIPSTSTYVWGDFVQQLHTFGLNANIVAGPATIKPFAAIQRGDMNKEVWDDGDAKGWMAGAVAKIKVGNAGAINASGIYLSGDKWDSSDNKAFLPVAAGTQYFNAANMWLLIRNGQQINSSTSVLGNDLTAGGHGLMGAFLGYEGKANKVFYNANIGWMKAAKAFDGENEDKEIGTEINAQVGYQLYDNLSFSVAGAYAFLGDGLNSTDNRLINLPKSYKAEDYRYFGAADADDPYMVNVQLSYTF